MVADDDLRVYPTRTSDLVTTEANAGRISGPVQVLDMAVRQVAVSGNYTKSQELSLGHLASGNYFLAVPTARGTVVRRVVVR